MADYWKQARRWQREHRRSGGEPKAAPRELNLTRDLRDPSGSSYSLKPRVKVVPNIGEVYRGQNPVAVHAPPRRAWGSPKNFVPKSFPRKLMFNMMMKNFQQFYDIGVALHGYVEGLQGTPVPIDPGQEQIPSYGPAPALDGNDYYFWNTGTLCTYTAAYAPGTRASGGRVKGVRGTGHHPGGYNCATFLTGSALPVPGIAPSPPVATAYWSVYTQNRIPGGAWESASSRTPWIGWRLPSSDHPTPHYQTVPKGAPAPVLRSPPRFGYLPSAEWALPWSPDQNQRLPWALRGVLNEAALALGLREDSGYDFFDPPQVEPSPQVVATIPPNKPPTITTGTNPKMPYRPPGVRTDRKVRIIGYQAFALVQGAFHGLTEYKDFEEALYEALPKHRQVCKGKGLGCKGAAVIKYWDEIDLVAALVNVVAGQIEDQLAGRFFNQLDKAARRLGTHEYKLLNGAADSPIDDAVGKVMAAVKKHAVEPTKEAITKEVKRYFGVL